MSETLKDMLDVAIGDPIFRVSINPYINDYDKVPRTWSERLLSWPWKPWQKFRRVYNPKVYKLSDGMWVMSPQSEQLLKEQP